MYACTVYVTHTRCSAILWEFQGKKGFASLFKIVYIVYQHKSVFDSLYCFRLSVAELTKDSMYANKSRKAKLQDVYFELHLNIKMAQKPAQKSYLLVANSCLILSFLLNRLRQS